MTGFRSFMSANSKLSYGSQPCAFFGGVVCGANFVLPALWFADEALIIGSAVPPQSRAKNP